MAFGLPPRVELETLVIDYAHKLAQTLVPAPMEVRELREEETKDAKERLTRFLDQMYGQTRL